MRSWNRRYASHFATLQQAGPTAPGTAPAVDPTPEQRIKQLETAISEQKRLSAKALKDAWDLNSVLRSMLQLEDDHGILLPKKSFRRPFPSGQAPKP